MTDILARLVGVSRCSNGWTARCPAHEDRHNSLSISHRDGRWLVKCHAGCRWEEIVAALGLDGVDLFDDAGGGGGGSIPATNPATAQPRPDSSGGAARRSSQTSPLRSVLPLSSTRRRRASRSSF